ncbi:hypothetical protein LINPERHAP1_LOCUS10840 [Linum perenne]
MIWAVFCSFFLSFFLFLLPCPFLWLPKAPFYRNFTPFPTCPWPFKVKQHLSMAIKVNNSGFEWALLT